MALVLRFAAVSDIGRTRKKNDDSGYAGPHFVMVADGMGGAAAGDLASAVAVQTMRRLDTEEPGDLLQALAGAVHRANDRLAELIEEDPAVEGMGTTVTAVLFEPTTSSGDDGAVQARIGVAHLGDSRGYLWRDGELLRISHDHSWVQSLIDEGRITEAEAKVHSHRSLLLKVLDGRHDNEPDLTLYDVQAGDRILICSDGLSGFVEHERIERVMGIGSAESVAGELLQLALEAASTDNITVVVADVVDEPDTVLAEPVVVGSAADHPRGALSRLRSWAQRDEVDPNEHLVDPDIDPEELRYAPREPRRFRWLVRGIILLVVLGVIAGLAKVAYDWTQKQYYVSASGDNVAIFKGIQADLPMVTMHEVYETDPLLLTQLPDYRREQVVEGLAADDLDDARAIVRQLTQMADACAAKSAASSSSSAASAASASSASAQATKQTKRPDKPGQGEKSRTGKPDDNKPRGSSTPPAETDTEPRKPRSAEECSGAAPSTGSDAPAKASVSTGSAP